MNINYTLSCTHTHTREHTREHTHTHMHTPEGQLVAAARPPHCCWSAVTSWAAVHDAGAEGRAGTVPWDSREVRAGRPWLQLNSDGRNSGQKIYVGGSMCTG